MGHVVGLVVGMLRVWVVSLPARVGLALALLLLLALAEEKDMAFVAKDEGSESEYDLRSALLI